MKIDILLIISKFGNYDFKSMDYPCEHMASMGELCYLCSVRAYTAGLLICHRGVHCIRHAVVAGVTALMLSFRGWNSTVMPNETQRHDFNIWVAYIFGI